jgi:nucleotide-binding universal stress UspA family protein
MTTSPVIVGYDGSRQSHDALRWALETAVRQQAPLVAIVADPPPLRQVSDVMDGEHTPMEWAVRQAENELGSATDASVEIHRGAIVPVLLRAAQDASMIVVGRSGHGRIADAVIGSVTQHLAHHAPCPVVAVHGWRLGNVPVDKHGDVPASLTARMIDHERLLTDSVIGVSEKFPEVELLTESIPVAAGRALADASITASLVAVGSRGRGAFPGLLLGSVSHYVLWHAHCPVAIVR